MAGLCAGLHAGEGGSCGRTFTSRLPLLLVTATPVWSPRGDYIAFTKQGSGTFAIGIMKPDGSGERILTEGYHNEGPIFAPNGRVLMFFREAGGAAGPSLYTVDINGRNEQKVLTPGFASDPAWSPLLT